MKLSTVYFNCSLGDFFLYSAVPQSAIFWSLLNQTIRRIINSFFYCWQEKMRAKPLRNSTARSERSLWLLITHCAQCNLKKQVSPAFIYLFSQNRLFYFFNKKQRGSILHRTQYTWRRGAVLTKRAHRSCEQTGLEGVWCASLPLPSRLFPWVSRTIQLSPPHTVFTLTHAEKKQPCASCVHTYMCVCVHAGFVMQTWRRDRGGLSSTSANWILPRRDSDEVLFIAAVIVSIFTPVRGYYSRPARSTGLSPSPSRLIY